MTIEIKRLNESLEGEYKELLEQAPGAMFYHSLKYRAFLKTFLIDSEEYYLLAYDQGKLVAALPVFVKYGPFGTVVNSLPFYGSHGGIIAKADSSVLTRHCLIDAFYDLCRRFKAICSTLIESPIDHNRTDYNAFQMDFQDERIGQITSLPDRIPENALENTLLFLYHQKTRNMVRKAMKSCFTVSHDGSSETFRTLHALHEANILGIGGIAKPWAVFEAIQDIFQYDEDYRIYTARHSGVIVSALLVFYFKGMVEYFTPATLETYRSHQPLSLLIFTAMKDAVLERNSSAWNWGGTWLSQRGVYLFKSRWGTTDYPYRYHVRVHNDLSSLKDISKEEWLAGYPFYYSVPFSTVYTA